MKTKQVFQLFLVLVMAGSLTISGCGQRTDPLPSWIEGATKSAIVKFVHDVTQKDGPKYVQPEERIATFDNDGTLWCEQPVVQGMFIMFRLEEMATADSSLREKQPFKAALENDEQYLKAEGWPALLELAAASHAGISQESFVAEVEAFFASARHSQLNLPIRQLAYQPMLELLAFLQANGFKTFICSGGGIDFMRVLSSRLYGIPPEQVIGSSMKKKLRKTVNRLVLTRTGKLNSLNDKEVKPVNIDLHVGVRPLLAMGNIRSGGDIAMLSYSQGRKGPSMQLLVNHDDEQREFVYTEKDNASMKAAKENGWHVVSIKNDWKMVFPTKE